MVGIGVFTLAWIVEPRIIAGVFTGLFAIWFVVLLLEAHDEWRCLRGGRNGQ